jgi:Ca-activated chloride channel homolog
MRRALGVLAACAMLGSAAATAKADGMIVPVRPEIRVRGSWAVKYHRVDIKVRDQVAMVTVDQEFVNTGAGMIEVEYLFPVPPDAAIDSMTLVVNGKEFEGKLLKADEARRIYEDIVRAKKDPALLEYAGYGLFRTRAFPLEAGKPAKVVVSYKNVCKKDRNLLEVWYPLNTEKFSAKAVEEVEVRVDARTSADIGTVYSPSHDIKWEFKDGDPRHVIATYSAKDVLPLADFQAFIKTTDKDVGATLLTYQPSPDRDGYFMLLASPGPKSASKVLPKDVVLVIDRSGSMAGKKIEQVRSAVDTILKNLNKDDRFNVIAYENGVDCVFDSLAPASIKKVEEAREWVDRLEVRGGTNIHDALQKALEMWGSQLEAGGARMFERPYDESRPKYVIFLTDGLPTVGNTDEKDILKGAAKANSAGARIFALGVGYDVNVRLLDRLVSENHGKSDYVKEKEDAGPKVASLYNKIKNPVMTRLTMEAPGLRLRDEYPRELGDLFDGDQIVVVGRYDSRDVSKLPADDDDNRRATVVIKGQFEGKQTAFEYPVAVNQPGRDRRYEFVEKMWAMRRIGFLLDQVQLHGESKEVVEEVIRLSREYGIITPYTSFLADERTAIHDMHGLRRSGETVMNDRLREAYSKVEGQWAAAERGMLNSAGEAKLGKEGDGWRYATPAAAPATRPADSVAIVGNTSTKAYEDGKVEYAAGVRQVGNQAVYKRGKTWIASNAAEADPEKDAAKIQNVDRFSKDYFELARRNSVAENQILATQKEGEELLVRLQGQLYRIR